MSRNFRACKLHSATHLLSIFNDQPLVTRVRPSSLTLIAGLVYQINGLHSRPDDSQYGRAIRAAIFPLTDDERSSNLLVPRRNDGRVLLDDYPNGIPFAPGGVIYLRDIIQEPTLRFRTAHSIEPDAFRSMFRCELEDVGRVIFNAGAARNAGSEGYVPQRKGHTFRRRGSISEQRRVRLDELNGMVAVPDASISDLEDDLQLPEVDQIHGADHVAQILEQFASDIMQKIGNPRIGGLPFPSYSSLPQHERMGLCLADINTLDLDRFFNQIQWRRAAEEDWKVSFNNLFPPVGKDVSPNMKHFPTCSYYMQYNSFMASLPRTEVKQVRLAIYKRFCKLSWIPAATSDRLWHYTKHPTWTAIPYDEVGGPRIWVNPGIKRSPVINRQVEDRIMRREEEEEGSGEEQIEQGGQVAPHAAAQLAGGNFGRGADGQVPQYREEEDDELDIYV
jgi:hypothetical protein